MEARITCHGCDGYAQAADKLRVIGRGGLDRFGMGAAQCAKMERLRRLNAG
jgi:hypothetical protein